MSERKKRRRLANRPGSRARVGVLLALVPEGRIACRLYVSSPQSVSQETQESRLVLVVAHVEAITSPLYIIHCNLARPQQRQAKMSTDVGVLVTMHVHLGVASSEHHIHHQPSSS